MDENPKPSTDQQPEQPEVAEDSGPVRVDMATVRLLIVAEMQEFAQFLAVAKQKRLSLSPEYLIDTLAIRCVRLLTEMDPMAHPNMEKIQPALEHGARLIDELAKQEKSRIILPN